MGLWPAEQTRPEASDRCRSSQSRRVLFRLRLKGDLLRAHVSYSLTHTLSVLWVAETSAEIRSIASMFLSIIAIVTLLTFPGWRTIVNDDGEELEMKPFPPRRRMHMSNAIVCAASIFSLISVLWLHVGAVAASATLDLVYNGAVDSGVGAVAMTLGWLSLSLQIWVCVMMRVMTISVDLLQNLKDED